MLKLQEFYEIEVNDERLPEGQRRVFCYSVINQMNSGEDGEKTRRVQPLIVIHSIWKEIVEWWSYKGRKLWWNLICVPNPKTKTKKFACDNVVVSHIGNTLRGDTFTELVKKIWTAEQLDAGYDQEEVATNITCQALRRIVASLASDAKADWTDQDILYYCRLINTSREMFDEVYNKNKFMGKQEQMLGLIFNKVAVENEVESNLEEEQQEREEQVVQRKRKRAEKEKSTNVKKRKM